jgi:hypothetical protein
MTTRRSQDVRTIAEGRRFEISVWPQTPGSGWRAEICTAGSEPLRFERPLDLLVFLTGLPGGAAAAPRGLR